MSLRRILVLALASILLAVPADAREVILGVEQSLTADSNLFNQSVDPTADGSYRIGPTVHLLEDRDVINYDFFYSPQYQVYMTTQDVNGWNQTFYGDLAYRPTARDEFTLETSALLRSAVQLLTDPGVTVDAAAVPGIGDTGHYEVDLTYRRMIGERWSGSVTGNYDQWTYTNRTAIPNVSGGGAAALYWAATPHVQTGVDLSSLYRRFDSVGAQPQSANVVSNASLFALWEFVEHWKLTLSGGPTYVAQRQSAPEDRVSNRYQVGTLGADVYAAPFANCPVFASLQLLESCFVDNLADTSNNLANPFEQVPVNFPPGTQTTSTSSNYATFFARALIGYKWQRGGLEFGYSRSQDASGGVASTNIRDALTLETTYRPILHTTLALYAEWSKRSSMIAQSRGAVTAVLSAQTTDLGNPLAEAGELTLIRFNTDQEIMQGRLILTATRQLTKNLRLSGQFSYTGQQVDTTVSNDTAGLTASSSARRFNRYVGRVFVRYEFDSFRF